MTQSSSLLKPDTVWRCLTDYILFYIKILNEISFFFCNAVASINELKVPVDVISEQIQS